MITETNLLYYLEETIGLDNVKSTLPVYNPKTSENGWSIELKSGYYDYVSETYLKSWLKGENKDG